MFLLLLLACAPESTVVTLTWYAEELECEENQAVWVPPSDGVIVIYTRYEMNGINFWSSFAYDGGVQGQDSDDDRVVVACSRDVSLVYAIVDGSDEG